MVQTTTYVDANLMHNLINGPSCTGILHFFSQTPIDWFAKWQAQVETSTYGSKFVAAQSAVEQVMDLRYTLRMLGVPIFDKAHIFGDNKGMVDSATIPHSKLKKRWVALSYHRVREAIAAGYVAFYYIPGHSNPADILTKALGWIELGPFVDVIMLWKGDTIEYLSRKDTHDPDVTTEPTYAFPDSRSMGRDKS